jgi:alkylation response protein AidB-like acyl-CoA dehydrogenase
MKSISRKRFSNLSRITGTETISPLIGLTEDQQTFYKLAKDFSDREMKPFAGKWDKDQYFPIDTYKKFGELGFGGMVSSGLSRVDATVIYEALSGGIYIYIYVYVYTYMYIYIYAYIYDTSGTTCRSIYTYTFIYIYMYIYIYIPIYLYMEGVWELLPC